jgi:hypothetical protein
VLNVATSQAGLAGLAGLDDVVEQLPVIAHNQFEIVVPLSGGITHAPR